MPYRRLLHLGRDGRDAHEPVRISSAPAHESRRPHCGAAARAMAPARRAALLVLARGALRDLPRAAIQRRRVRARHRRVDDRRPAAGARHLGAVRPAVARQPAAGARVQRGGAVLHDGIPAVQPPFHGYPSRAEAGRRRQGARDAVAVARTALRRSRSGGDRAADHRAGAGRVAPPGLRGGALVRPAAGAERRRAVPAGRVPQASLGGRSRRYRPLRPHSPRRRSRCSTGPRCA